jgi:hypothetical protein
VAEYLRDPAWQFVGAVLAALAIGATVGIYWLQRQRKRLSYEVVSRNRLLTVTEEHQSKLRVTYDGEPVKDLSILVIRLVNSGNVPIAAQDFATPVIISAGDRARVFSAAITDTDPVELLAEIEKHDEQVLLVPTLLNAGDAITLKLLVSDYGGKASVFGRIVGVKTIGNLSKPTALLNVLAATGLLLTLAGGYMFFKFKPEVTEPPLPIYSKIGFALFCFGYLAIGFSLARRSSFLRIFRALASR